MYIRRGEIDDVVEELGVHNFKSLTDSVTASDQQQILHFIAFYHPTIFLPIPSINGFASLSDGKLPRPDFISSIEKKKLEKYRLVQIRGTPASGKTTTLSMLYKYLLRIYPNAIITIMNGNKAADTNNLQDDAISSSRSSLLYLVG
ncbi:hypothetical protein BDP27DRAFT_624852 [Rhodocollybia butyracea]|uniref:Uncharacterized protein n=1 Tax=Rhodocollybia butyracea TaxID=206335 RepID=A0A9P5PQM9_9AGAR|nr:hypothetical protein BDP27DRAFT_624852 [Rhodocollybia butyracea]